MWIRGGCGGDYVLLFDLAAAQTALLRWSGAAG
jgi:hypothetical protein